MSNRIAHVLGEGDSTEVTGDTEWSNMQVPPKFAKERQSQLQFFDTIGIMF